VRYLTQIMNFNLKGVARRLLVIVGAIGLQLASVHASENVIFYGNSLVERLMEEGDLEAYLQLAKPASHVSVRSLAWTGDEVGYRLRPEGYVEHMKSLLARWTAGTVVIGFGNNESFGGEAGLTRFKKDWEVYLNEIKRLHPEAKLVLLSPVAAKTGGDVGIEVRQRAVLAYSKAIEEIARSNGGTFVDLLSPTLNSNVSDTRALVPHGIDLSETELWNVAKLIAKALLGDSSVDAMDLVRVREVAKAVALKSGYVADVVRPKNGVVYYGVRKRADENEAEIPRYHEMIERTEALIHDMVQHPEKKMSDYPRPSLPPLPEGKSVPDRFSGGIMKSPLEQQKDITVAEGYALNCFASE